MTKNPYKGKLLNFEGIDGSGKSRQFEMLHDKLVTMPDINVAFGKEPTGGPVGRAIYDILYRRHPTMKFEEMTDLEMQKLYFQDRRSHYQDMILPSLRGGVHFMSDRGPASVAYGLKDLSDLDRFLAIESAMFHIKSVPFILPDKIIIYDVNVDIALERLGKKGNVRDTFEERERLEQVRANYLAIVEKIPNCVIIDGTESEDKVFEETLRHVLEVLDIK